MTTVELIFGLASLLGLLFAIFVYFKRRDSIYLLIEKLRASWNNFIETGRKARRIVNIAESKERSPEEKVQMMRQVARAIEEGVDRHMNTIDDGKDWGELSAKEIYKKIK